MLIEQINKNTVKIHISNMEMKEFGVDYNSICNNRETEDMLALLMNEIDYNTTMKTENETFFIEAFEQNDKSCVLFISSISENGVEDLSEIYGLSDCSGIQAEYENCRNKELTVIFSSSDTQALFDVVNLVRHFELSELTSYKLGNDFKLVLKVKKDEYEKFYRSLLEFGTVTENDELSYSVIQEYYEPVSF